MSNRIIILTCGAVERIEDNILDEVQIQVLDRITHKYYNVDCYLIGEPENGDTYEINIYSVEKGKWIDSCRMDSSGGVFMDEGFSCDEIDDELGFEIIKLFTQYFIVPF